MPMIEQPKPRLIDLLGRDDSVADDFKPVIGVELVTTRQHLSESNPKDLASFIRQLAALGDISYVSFTDNAGGRPGYDSTMLVNETLETRLIPLVHLTCKDGNRYELQKRAWGLHLMGVTDILALTGDYPVAVDEEGVPEPSFDLDSASLVYSLNRMNGGLVETIGKRSIELQPTDFTIGVAVNPFKGEEAVMQYGKLRTKAAFGAHFVIPQIGYDNRKFDELIKIMGYLNIKTPVIGNVYFLSRGAAFVFNKERVAGVQLSNGLYNIIKGFNKDKLKERNFFLEFAAHQMAVYLGMGARGIHLGGVENIDDVREILEIYHERKGEWRNFADKTDFPTPDQSYIYMKDTVTGLNTEEFNPEYKRRSGSITIPQGTSIIAHRLLFEPDTIGYRAMTRFYEWLESKPRFAAIGYLKKTIGKVAYFVERTAKYILYDCEDCGQCSLPELEYLCPESGCSKNLRDGPCGGSKPDKTCEKGDGNTCFYVERYNRQKARGTHLLDPKAEPLEIPIITDSSLRKTSSWRNFFTRKDYHAKSTGNAK